MFKIIHPNPSFVVNESDFKTQQDAEQHMKLIQKFTKEWVSSGYMTQEDADKYYNEFQIKEI